MHIEPSTFASDDPAPDVCGGRGCCDAQWNKEHGYVKQIDYQQLFPAVALFSFLGGICCMGLARRKQNSAE